LPLPAPPLPSSPHHHRLPSLPRLLSPWRPTASTSPLPGSPPPPPPFPSTLPSMAHMGRVRHPPPLWHIRGGARGRPSPPGQIRRPPVATSPLPNAFSPLRPTTATSLSSTIPSMVRPGRARPLSHPWRVRGGAQGGPLRSAGSHCPLPYGGRVVTGSGRRAYPVVGAWWWPTPSSPDGGGGRRGSSVVVAAGAVASRWWWRRRWQPPTVLATWWWPAVAMAMADRPGRIGLARFQPGLGSFLI
jgi:hypothetical protein